MVVRINFGKSIRRALSYNEGKLTDGKADLLLAQNFPVDEHLMGFSTKMNVFQSLIDRNPKIMTNAVHISLNFPPEENLTNEKLSAIASEYMERIGFADQPFLVYRHNDSSHPHIHIVTTHLRSDRRPVGIHNIAKEKSEPARKELEIQFGLIPAASRKPQPWVAQSVPAWPADYGKQETKHAITNIVGKVLSSYKFGDLDQFNAVLAQFRITAHRGAPESRMHKANGLVYQLLDTGGNRIGLPIKASSIQPPPTLKNLEKHYAKGSVGKLGAREGTRRDIDRCIQKSESIDSLAELLQTRDIGLLIQRDKTGSNGATYFIDHRRKSVFTAEELGINSAELSTKKASPVSAPETVEKKKNTSQKPEPPKMEQISLPASTLSLLHTLFSDTGQVGAPDDDNAKKKKRRKRQSL